MIYGTYYLGHSSTAKSAFAIEQGTERVVIICSASNRVFIEEANFTLGLDIPGQAVDLEFPDGSIFTPNAVDFRWASLERRHSLSRFETSRLAILVSILLIPTLLYLTHAVGLPAAAASITERLPPDLKAEIGNRSYETVETLAMEDSTLPDEVRQMVLVQWSQALETLSLADDRFSLHFHDAPGMGANAFALPNGSIIVTDDLVRLYTEHPERLQAILLHEIGHVEHEHGLQLAIRSIGSTILLSMLIGGDLDGITELVMGTGNTFLQSSFSRDMEREADTYALDHLPKLGHSPATLGHALADLRDSDKRQGRASDQAEALLNYLSSHPATSERIESALNADETFEGPLNP